MRMRGTCQGRRPVCRNTLLLILHLCRRTDGSHRVKWPGETVSQSVSHHRTVVRHPVLAA
jgi:hypothetical protein